MRDACGDNRPGIPGGETDRNSGVERMKILMIALCVLMLMAPGCDWVTGPDLLDVIEDVVDPVPEDD